MEISAGYYLTPLSLAPDFRSVHLGLVYRGQSYKSEFGRRTIAAQLGAGYVGVEAGWAWRDGVGVSEPAQGVHISPYVSLGVLYLGPQILLRGNVEYSFNVGLKFPLPHVLLLPFLTLLSATPRCC